MEKYVKSSDGMFIHYRATETKPVALVFIHGALGNAAWWDEQADFFRDRYTAVRMDLPGHGKSVGTRTHWSSSQYAEDIKAVVGQLDSQKIILVGHSMSGAYALEASLLIPRTIAIVLVDTLKDMKDLMDFETANQVLFGLYRRDFRSAVENILPNYLFSGATPPAVQRRIREEFLQYDPEFAINSLEPLYRMDIRRIAGRVNRPVRAINSDFTPTNLENNLTYFRDYQYVNIRGTGHYPMLEKPDEFNRALEQLLTGLPI